MVTYNTQSLIGLLGIVAYAIYASSRKRPFDAVLLTILLAALYGPEMAFIKIPLLPTLNKERIATTALFVIAMIKFRRHISRAGWFSAFEVLVVMGFFGSVMTGLTNGDAIVTGPDWRRITLPGLAFRDGVYDALTGFFTLSVPFLLGRWLFRRPDHLDRVLRVLVMHGTVMGLLCLVEMRMSPQVHLWVYGFTQTSGGFDQTMRWGGWRPTVFMEHGLALVMFMLSTFIASSTFARLEPALRFPRRFPIKRVNLYLGVVTVFCKSTGAVLYMAVLTPLLRLASAKAIARTCMILALIAGAYPLLRLWDWVPVDDLVDLISKGIDPERAASLEFRFVNERGLLHHAMKRPWFGWGNYDRNFVFDDGQGNAYLIADGFWVIAMGTSGFVGFLHSFGLPVGAVLLAVSRYRRIADPALQIKFLALTTIVAIHVLDYLPNGMYYPYPFLFAGALVGFSQEIGKARSDWRVPAPVPG